ncbi:ADP-ribosylglycohydrolase family protein [Halorussus salinisoli]|uniref:ADP-ribosylglycohydrolase family protein n=1 Tax=Halorussus salinisoli TaxID=2558242 RepID=UPI0010C243CD|nr:ADP-ribosylglycohydrolase family protein [Halorussus salinisoli]
MAVDELDGRGVLLGLACGDALGRPVEFWSPDRIAHDYDTLTEMVGDGTWGKPSGTITDDTDLALCIARSLVECDNFDPTDVASRFVDWYDSGPFDIGNMTAQAINRLKQGDPWDVAGQQVWEASPEGSNAGNGSIMRCPPLAIPYADDLETLARVSRQSSQITHADPRCTYGCAVLNLTIAGYLNNAPNPLTGALDRLGADMPAELQAALEPLANGDRPDSLSTSGYVVHTLQTALHDVLTADTAEDAIVTAVNRGGDTDTVGAVAGAVAGARFGASELPARWVAEIDEERELRRLATDLCTVEGD